MHHSGKKPEMVDKKVTESDVGEGLPAKKKWCPHSKNTETLRVTCFLNDPYDGDLFCCIFMSAFADDVISILWNKLNNISK